MKTLLLIFALIISLFFEGGELLSSLLDPFSSEISSSLYISSKDSDARNNAQNEDNSNNAKYSPDDFKDIPPSKPN